MYTRFVFINVKVREVCHNINTDFSEGEDDDFYC